MNLDLSRYFVKVVQNGSFSRAADLMKVPKSTVSKAVARLEKETGTKLLLRTTRSLTLTATGRVFYDGSHGAIQALEDAQKSLHGRDSILSGTLKITAPEDLGSLVLAPVIAGLSRNHPELNFELIYTDEIIDLIRDGFDLAFRVGKLNESRFKVRRMGEISLTLVASPDYLNSAAKIRTPRDLETHSCISFREKSLQPVWQFKSRKETARVAINPRVSSNQMTSLVKMAIANGGVASVPRYICKEDIAAGRLIEVLPAWARPAHTLSMITPLPVSSSARLKLTADRLADAVAKALL